MALTEEQVKDSIALGIEYLSRLLRRIRRPDGTLQLMPETDLAVSHDSPGIALTRVIPKNNGQVQGGPETISTTGVALPVLKMQGDLLIDFDCLVIGVPDHGGVTNILSSGPTLEGDTWTFEQTGDYTFKVPGPVVLPSGDALGLPIRPSEIQPLVDESSWSVRYKSTWSASSAFPPKFQISVKKISGPERGGVLAWDNFAVVPESTQDYVMVVGQEGEQPQYRSPTSFHTTRYHKNIAMANRHLALHSGNRRVQQQLPFLENFWRQFSAVPGQEAADPADRIIDADLYDGLWGWGGDRETPIYIDQFPPWLIAPDTFYDPDLYARLFPMDVARAPYQSHAASKIGNLGYREVVWGGSPQLRTHVAIHQLNALADTEAAWQWLNTVAWDGVGIRRTGYPNGPAGMSVDSYKGNWLAIWLCGVTLLEAYLSRTGDPNGHLPRVKELSDEAAVAVLKAQVQTSGVFRDNTFGRLCQPEHAGGVFNGYDVVDADHFMSKGWHSRLFGIAEFLGDLMGVYDRDPTQMPHHVNTPTSYEPTYWSMVGLTYYLKNRFN